ncbi:MAG: Glu/Leu/Phe/Val family dehydrogenase [Ilumatobacteraceae bacterium]
MSSTDPSHDKSLESIEFRMREAGRWLKLEDGVIETLIAPRRVLEVSIPIRRDDGTRIRFTGWRVQHNITRGPAKGGIRYHSSVNRDETVSLAVAMSLKTALMNLPLGGAKGGVAVDPKLLSPRELERVTRRYVSEIFAFLGPDKDVPAPDVGTNSQVMAWVMDQYSIGIGHAVPGVVTGKPLALGGSLGRDSATGRGVVEAASLVCQANGTSLEGKRIVIQGFGNVGMWAARLAAGWGAKIVGVSDVGGVVASEKGLDVQALVRATQNGVGSVVDAGVGEVIARGVESSTKVFALPSDIAMPCALGGAIDKDEAVSLTAKYVIEGANGPLTPAADEVLNDRAVIVVPDIYANAGGVTCSYLEQCQNYAHLQWDEDEVNASVVNTMRAVFKRLHAFSTENDLNYRKAASVLGVKALADAHQLRGLHP